MHQTRGEGPVPLDPAGNRRRGGNRSAIRGRQRGENAMALGDSGNDESILRAAGLGVAMGNAPDFINAVADVVTEPHDRDGAAIAIEQYCL